MGDTLDVKDGYIDEHEDGEAFSWFGKASVNNQGMTIGLSEERDGWRLLNLDLTTG